MNNDLMVRVLSDEDGKYSLPHLLFSTEATESIEEEIKKGILKKNKNGIGKTKSSLVMRTTKGKQNMG
ncbi:hypothetical protein ACFPYJ_02580 [Paenibacillus solisilvae]|uniref:Uncharacterized protein n=1 Tax=Paenibacillus solisilvae TaxID=2486751 RepID=A0ABW0VTP3_9BACL